MHYYSTPELTFNEETNLFLVMIKSDNIFNFIWQGTEKIHLLVTVLFLQIQKTWFGVSFKSCVFRNEVFIMKKKLSGFALGSGKYRYCISQIVLASSKGVALTLPLGRQVSAYLSQ